MENKQFFSVREIMAILGLSRAHAYKLISENEIPSIRLGRKVIIPGWFVRKLSEEPK